MNVVAVRDDGALLVEHDPANEAAAIVSDNGVYFTSKGAAFARGSWDDPNGDETVPEHLSDVIEERLTALAQDPSMIALDNDPRDADLTASAEPKTGAMVALVPVDEDVDRLVVRGGESADQLHVTLCYLGDAVNFAVDERFDLIAKIADCVKGLPIIEGDGFAISIFNPEGTEREDGDDREPCVVLGLSGEELALVHGLVLDKIMRQTVADYVPEQHSPWVPHITLDYTTDTDLKKYVDKTGPVRFDKIRVAFAGDNYDIPLGDYEGGPTSTTSTETEPLESSETPTAPLTDSYSTVLTDELTTAEVELIEGVYLATHAELTETFAQERDVNSPAGPGHQLRDYWVHGPGAIKIGWGTDGSMRRCMAELGKYVKDPGGLCAEYHHRATGEWPRGGTIPSEGDVVPFDFDPDQPRDYHGRWSEVTDVATDAAKSFAKRFRRANRGEKAKKSTQTSDYFAPRDDKKKPSHSGTYLKDGVTFGTSGIGTYQEQAYQINGGLRDGSFRETWKTDDQGFSNGFSSATNALDQMFSRDASKLKDDIIVHRGILAPRLTFGDKWSDDSNVGLMWIDPGFTSTTWTEDVAQKFTSTAHNPALSHLGILEPGSVFMNILVPKGSHALRMGDIGTHKNFMTEDEIVLPRESKFRIMVDHGVGNDGVRRIDVELIPYDHVPQSVPSDFGSSDFAVRTTDVSEKRLFTKNVRPNSVDVGPAIPREHIERT